LRDKPLLDTKELRLGHEPPSEEDRPVVMNNFKFSRRL
jgi:hypothetical protein